MSSILRRFFPLAILFISLLAEAQKDSLAVKSDSINTQILIDYNKRIAEIESQRISDSIRKAELERQLESLQTTDNLKKAELEKKLQSLVEKESVRIQLKKAQIDSLRHTANGFPVRGFFEDTLFLIYSRLGSFSAADRADIIAKRINKLGSYFGFKADSLKLEETETTVDIVFGETILMSVSENDALWCDTSKMELAQNYKQIIGEEVTRYKAETSLATLLKELGLALLVLTLLGILIFGLVRLFRWIAIKIRLQEGQKIRGIKIKNFTLLDAQKQVKALLTVNTVAQWILILLSTYIALLILFRIFPWTKHIADALFGYFLNPVKDMVYGFWNYLPNLITILVILFVFRYIFRLLRFFKVEIERGNLHLPGFYPDWANPTYQIVRVFVFAFMIVVIFPYLPGSDSPVFQGVSVFLGFLFTFGSSGSLSNIVAGLILTYMRLFNIGDRVKIGDVTGDVIEKSLLVTRIRTIKNEIISIPNSTVMNSHTVNYSIDAPEKGLIIYSTVTIGYDVPWKDMQKALIDAALKTKLVLQDPAPFVLQTSLDDFYVSYQVNAYTHDANKQAQIYSDLHQNIQDICNERGIEIMSPHYRAARDGNTITIPSDYRPKDYKAPDFNIAIKKDDSK